MTQEDRNDAILVKILRLEDDGDTKYLCSYYTTAIDQVLKMYITAKEYNIECYVNEFSESIPDELKSFGYMIKDIYLTLGSNTDINVINVVVE